MAATKGNQFWKMRSKHGRDKLFESPELLMESATNYFQWCDDNPWITIETTSSSKDEVIKEKPTQRPYSRGGWYHFVGCSDTWLKNFKKTASEDFLRVIEEIENCIDTQQWEGAAVGAFNANIIARTLGLADSQKIDANVINNPISPEEIEQRRNQLDNEL
jgi:hypothetical protein